MWLVWYVSNFWDNDLVDTNIKEGVDIFGVEGTYTGALWGRTIQYVTNFAVRNEMEQTWNDWTRATTSTNYIVGVYFTVASWWQNSWMVARTPKTGTLAIGWTGKALSDKNSFISVYQEWNTLHCNHLYYYNNPNDPYHVDYNMETDTWWNQTAWYNTTGTLLTSHIVADSWITYTFLYNAVAWLPNSMVCPAIQLS